MDYKKIYQESFDKTISNTEVKIIANLKASRIKDINANTVLNEIGVELYKHSMAAEEAIQKKFLDIYNSQQSAIKEYESNHFENFLKHDFPKFSSSFSESQLKNFITDLSVLKAHSKANINFDNSREYLEYAYKLNKNYSYYNLNFDSQESNPVHFKVFNKMKKELYPNSMPEPGINLSNDIQTTKSSSNKINLTKNEKIYLAFLLYDLNYNGIGIGKAEFIRILILIENTFKPEMLSTTKLGNFTEYIYFNNLNMNRYDKMKFLQNLKSKLTDLKLDIINTEIEKKLGN